MISQTLNFQHAMCRHHSVFIKFILLLIVCCSNASFHYGNEYIPREDDGFELRGLVQSDKLPNETAEISFYKDWSAQLNESFARSRAKRSEEGTFYGHPKTREERWHEAFNMNRSNSQIDQAHSLVLLLVKVMDKYLNACIPVVLYDQYVESSDGTILQTFFQVG